MDKTRAFLTGRFSLLLAVLLGAGSVSQPAAVDAEGLFTVRRSVGLVFLGSSAFMVKQGLDFKDEADDYFQRYEKATDPEEIDRLYRRTNNRDMKSQISWALAAAFGVSGLRLILVDGSGSSDEQSGPARKQAIPRLELESRLDAGRVGLDLKKRFF